MVTRARLSILGGCVLGVLSGLLIVVGGYVGWVYGAIWGLMRAEPILNAPAPPGVGLAPNLAPLVDASVEVIVGIVLGVLSGMAIGSVLAWLIGGYVLAPLLLRIPYLHVETAMKPR